MIAIIHLIVSGLIVGLTYWAVFLGAANLLWALFYRDGVAFVASLGYVLLAYALIHLLRFSWSL